MKTCEECIFFVEAETEDVGVCHASPPVIVCCDDGVADMRPSVHRHDTACRFFRQKRSIAEMADEYEIQEFPY